MAQDKADDILARFPGPVALPPSRIKWVLILLACAAFTAVGVFLMPKNESMTWASLTFFGVGTVIALVMLLPGAGGLTLNREGFEMVNLFRRNIVRWPDSSDFMAEKIPGSPKKMVLFNLASAKQQALGHFNTSIIGRNSAVPDTYGMSAETLAALMAAWRERAMR